ncbi:short chain dehydrogenase/reductase-like protein [Exidia glandulosa HHB12029]|uniref:Short chain dehydrogenase/reductase-like protein n=1 Tax=Exidia glandulosa HHB12029 TaxID=1314781 RepID=A0A165BE83_EXIGL|nr:short chain dehydrogenase/reductase-like protein [Exidia glandulosa HHB12029]
MPGQKTVLITGCSPGGIGHALALEFHAKGCRVFATGRNVDKLADLQAKGIETFALDVTSDTSVKAAVAKVGELTGGTLDILFNNAGQAYYAAATDVDIDEVRGVFETNLFGVMRMVRHFAPLLVAAKGKIVNVGSVSGIIPYAFGSPYNATKAALHSYGDTLRVEMAPFGVDVITVVTGGVTSNVSENAVSRGKEVPEGSLYEPIADVISRKRMNRSRAGAMPTAVYARKVVATVLRRSPTWYWLGELALSTWFIATFLPRKTFDFFISRAVGLNELTKLLRQRQKAQ